MAFIQVLQPLVLVVAFSVRKIWFEVQDVRKNVKP
jgi:hypothetical protein